MSLSMCSETKLLLHKKSVTHPCTIFVMIKSNKLVLHKNIMIITNPSMYYICYGIKIQTPKECKTSKQLCRK
jgi:hypothetical protein